MSGKAFIHINGVDYEHAYPVDGDASNEFRELEQKVERLTSGEGAQVTFDVMMGGARTMLRATTQGVFAAAVFFVKDRVKGRGRAVVL